MTVNETIIYRNGISSPRGATGVSDAITLRTKMMPMARFPNQCKMPNAHSAKSNNLSSQTHVTLNC